MHKTGKLHTNNNSRCGIDKWPAEIVIGLVQSYTVIKRHNSTILSFRIIIMNRIFRWPATAAVFCQSIRFRVKILPPPRLSYYSRAPDVYIALHRVYVTRTCTLHVRILNSRMRSSVSRKLHGLCHPPLYATLGR